MFLLQVKENHITALKQDLITSGAVDAFPVQFSFSQEWDGLTKDAVFRAGYNLDTVRLNENGMCNIPETVLTEPFLCLECGVCGTDGKGLVYPTNWVRLGEIQEGVSPE